jgi:CRISPR-associated exonuclease Cas4
MSVISPAWPQPDELDPEPIPISALQHAVYCLRQAALIHLERQWAENRLTAEGRVLHEAADRPDGRYSRGIRREMALHLSSRRLGIAGIADVVEFRRGPSGDVPYPIEHKRGRPKPHRADEVQLCAQALCLEEMTGAEVPEGALFYAEPRRRLVVTFDSVLRELTEETAAALRALFATATTPPAVYRAALCRNCSLLDICQPKAGRKSARAWLEGELHAMLAEDREP